MNTFILVAFLSGSAICAISDFYDYAISDYYDYGANETMISFCQFPLL